MRQVALQPELCVFMEYFPNQVRSDLHPYMDTKL